MLDRPAVDRQRLREGTREKQVQLAPRAGAGEQEAVFDTHGARCEGMDLHRALPGFMDVGTSLPWLGFRFPCESGCGPESRLGARKGLRRYSPCGGTVRPPVH